MASPTRGNRPAGPGCGTRPLVAAVVLAATAALAGCAEEPEVPADPQVLAARPWIDQLAAGEPPERAAAIDALSRIDHPVVVEPLLNAACNDIQVHLRIRAIRALARPDLVEDVGPLVRLLSSPEDEVRLATCEVLGRLGRPEAVDPLAECVTDDVTFVRLAAIEALSRLGPAGLSRLDRMFAEGSTEERAAIADAFGRSGDPGRVEKLLEALKADEDALRRSAADALGRLGDEQAVGPLVELVREPLSKARLAGFEERSSRPVTEADLDAIRQMLDAELVRRGERPGKGSHSWLTRSPDAAKPMLRRLIDRRRRDAARLVRSSALAAILQIGGPKADEAVLDLLAADDADVAEAVRDALDDREAAKDLLYAAVADAKRPTVARIRAVRVLLREGAEAARPRADEQLLRALRGETTGNDTTVGATPAEALARPLPSLDPRLRAALIDALEDPDRAFRAYAAGLLAERKVEAAVEPLIGLLDSDDPDVRRRAISGLANFRDPRPVPKLLSLLKDSRAADCHKQVIETLAAIGDRRAVPALMKIAAQLDHPRQFDAIEAVGRIGDLSAGEGLIEIYRAVSAVDRSGLDKNEERPLRWATERLLAAMGQVKAAEALPLLVEIIQGERDWGLVHQAMTALGAIGDRAAVEPLVDRLRRGPYRFKGDKHVNYTTQAGIDALVALGDPLAVPLLDRFVRRPPDKPTQDHAFRALGRLRCPESARVLLGYLADPKIDPAVKETGVGPALAAIGPVAKEGLLELLAEAPPVKDETASDPGIYAAQLLALLGADAVDDLSEVARKTKKRHVLGRVVEAAWRIDDDSAADLLGTLAQSDDDEVRQWAVKALGRMKRPAAVPHIQAAMGDPDAEVTKWARWALRQHGETEGE